MLALLTLVTALFAQGTGWTPLFDGKTPDRGKRPAGTAEYKVEDGAIVGATVAGSGNTFLVTEKEYDNFILEMDIRIDPSSRRWSGGIYDEGRRGRTGRLESLF